jgi:hypothetical protein
MREIPLSHGYVAFVDDEDYELVSKYNWSAYEDSNGMVYAICYTTRYSRNIRMHRLIMNAPDGMDVDHADRDGLNNRRSNLRLATRSQNNANSVVSRNSKSGYKGVCLDSYTGRWKASIMVDYKHIHLGRFDTKEEAAMAYDKAAVAAFGEFARTNFPTESG